VNNNNSGGGGGGTIQYTVAFNTNGGNTITNQRVAINSKAVQPANPTKEGFTFTGWYTDSALTNAYDFDGRVSGNITIYAGWSEIATVIEPTGTPLATPDANPFVDVGENDWYFDDIAYVYERNLFQGTSETVFAPSTPMSRGMFVTALWRLSGSPAASGSEFTDVAAEAGYALAVDWAASNGIVQGVGAGLFAPEELVTREQIAAMMYRYGQFSGMVPQDTTVFSEFADWNSISDYARIPVQTLVTQGIIQGKPGNLFAPSDTATRAEAAALFHRYVAAVE
jgi:uncharacterized repeat protein (TIGR02543 family)